jgi:hypothetical protein
MVILAAVMARRGHGVAVALTSDQVGFGRAWVLKTAVERRDAADQAVAENEGRPPLPVPYQFPG